MKNHVIKTIIKNLSNAPQLAAAQTLKELQTPEERAEANRIFNAIFKQNHPKKEEEKE